MPETDWIIVPLPVHSILVHGRGNRQKAAHEVSITRFMPDPDAEDGPEIRQGVQGGDVTKA